MKKFFSIKSFVIFFAAILCVCMFPLSFGCAETEENSSNIPDIYIKVTDNKGNTFYMGKDGSSHEKFISYEYSYDEKLRFETEAFYQNGEKYIGENYINFDRITINMSEPGNQTLWQIYPIENDYAVCFKLTVQVREYNS